MKLQIFGLALLSGIAVVASAPAQAQNGFLTRSFVSSSGMDSNPCNITQPCATFAQAYTTVGANGIVAALDPGKYGPLTITGPVTINGNGWAAITGPANGSGITINAGSTDNIILIGLELDGAGAATRGVQFNSGGTLSIRGSMILNFNGPGVSFAPTGSSQLFVSDTLISNNGAVTNGDANGIYISAASSTSLSGAVDHVRIENNSSDGISILGVISTNPKVNFSISNSVIANNAIASSQCGISVAGNAGGNGGGKVTVAVSDTVIEGNGAGVCNGGGYVTVRNSTISNSIAWGIDTDQGTTWITRSTITGNGTGILTLAGSTYSFGDNNLYNNSTEGSFTSPQQGYQ